MNHRANGCWVALLLMLSALPAWSQSDETRPVSSTSNEFKSSAAASIERLKALKFNKAIQSSYLGPLSDLEVQGRILTIRRNRAIDGEGPGRTDVLYDVVLQPGHYRRYGGNVGAYGKFVSEQALMAYFSARIAEDLRRHSLNVLVVAADGPMRPTPGLQSKVFLAIHADPRQPACKLQWGIGYESGSSMLALHALGWGLGAALGYNNYEAFMKENLSVAVSHYDLFDRVGTRSLKALLEVGELTCPDSEEVVLLDIDLIAGNVASALRLAVDQASE